MGEKRTSKRFPIFSEMLSCSITEQGCVRVDVVDMSSGGIGITVGQRLAKSDVLQLEIKVPGDDIPMFVRGEVAWVEKDENNDRYKAGIVLTKIERSDKVRLVKFLDNNHKFL
jgi:c-di-GMP-binding flagellar brake protein YcgR